MTIEELIGRWVTDPIDTGALARFGRVTLEFKEGGKLIYTIREGDTNQVMLLTYRAQEGVLLTNQPSKPREEATPFYMTPDGKLVLVYGGAEARYVREG